MSERRTQTDAETVAGIGIVGTSETQTDSTAGIAGHVEVVSAPADRTRIRPHDVQFFMSTAGVKVVQYDLPDSAAHIGQTKTVAAPFAIMIDR